MSWKILRKVTDQERKRKVACFVGPGQVRVAEEDYPEIGPYEAGRNGGEARL